MKFHVVTLFPELIRSALGHGLVGQALEGGRIELETISPREFTTNVHQTVDDRPFGGGDGMIMLAEPLALAVAQAKAGRDVHTVHLSPRGRPLTDAKVRELAQLAELVIIASRYGGVDQRFLNAEIDEEISIGDYVLSGGEFGALVLIDALARQLPGVLGNERSAHDESFSPARAQGLEEPQFTRPREWRGLAVPEALFSGHHERIKAWKSAVSLLITLKRRPDLLGSRTSAEWWATEKVLNEMTDLDLEACGLGSRADLQRLISEQKAQNPKDQRGVSS